jgi:hypothetical protein
LNDTFFFSAPQLKRDPLGGAPNSVNVKSFLLMLVIASCGLPSDDQVKADFLTLHPRAVIEFSGVGEGDADHASWCIRFREPPDTTLREQIWLYQRGADDRFHVAHRDSSVVKGKTCGGAT